MRYGPPRAGLFLFIKDCYRDDSATRKTEDPHALIKGEEIKILNDET